MAESNARSMPTRMFAVLLLMFAAQLMVKAQTKIDGAVDLVFIATVANTPGQEAKGDDFEAMKAAYIKLATFFVVDDRKTELAVVSQIASENQTDPIGEKIVLNLTGDRQEFNSILNSWDPQPSKKQGTLEEYDRNITDAFTAVKKHIFTRSTHRARIIVLISVRDDDDDRAAKVSKELLDDNVFIYAIARNESVAPNDKTIAKAVRGAKAYTSAPERLFVLNTIDMRSSLDKTMLRVREAIVRDLCDWNWTCLFVDKSQTKCEFHAWKRREDRYLKNSDAICPDAKPSATCTRADCESTSSHPILLALIAGPSKNGKHLTTMEIVLIILGVVAVVAFAIVLFLSCRNEKLNVHVSYKDEDVRKGRVGRDTRRTSLPPPILQSVHDLENELNKGFKGRLNWVLDPINTHLKYYLSISCGDEVFFCSDDENAKLNPFDPTHVGPIGDKIVAALGRVGK